MRQKSSCLGQLKSCRELQVHLFLGSEGGGIREQAASGLLKDFFALRRNEPFF